MCSKFGNIEERKIRKYEIKTHYFFYLDLYSCNVRHTTFESFTFRKGELKSNFYSFRIRNRKKDFVQKYHTRRSTSGLGCLNGIVCRVSLFILTGMQRTYLFVCVFSSWRRTKTNRSSCSSYVNPAARAQSTTVRGRGIPTTGTAYRTRKRNASTRSI